jgi:hypothetical protein
VGESKFVNWSFDFLKVDSLSKVYSAKCFLVKLRICYKPNPRYFLEENVEGVETSEWTKEWFFGLSLNIKESLVVTVEFCFVISGLYLSRFVFGLSLKSIVLYYVLIFTKSITDFLPWCYFYRSFGAYLKRIFELYIGFP